MPTSHPASPIQGVCPVLVTPFSADGAPDAAALGSVVEFAIAAGADAVVYPGVASEVDQLSDSERDRLLEVVAASAKDAEATLRHLILAKRLGAAAAMVMAPARLAGDVAGLIEHYRRIGEAAAVPVMLQNAPPPAGGGFDAAALGQVIARVPAVRYVKEEAMPCGQRITALLARPEIAGAPHFAGVLGGAGARYLLDELARGAMGTMPACELADVHVRMMRAWRAGDTALAPGHVIHVDVGLRRDGYASDLQRTWYWLRDGETEAPEAVRKAFEATRAALDAGMAAALPLTSSGA